MTCIVEIICIGNELLIGKVANTNAQWLSKRVTSLGGYVKRINVVGDTLDEIGSVLIDSLSRDPSFIITTGGLGPTFDDITLEAIAKALDLPMSVDEEALNILRNRYHQREVTTGRKMELTPARLKMATIPKGARLLQNPVGAAPGVLLVTGESKIITFPGVPREMEAIFEEKVGPLIRESAGDMFFCEMSLNVTDIVESMISPLIDEAMRKSPQVYIKSHPKAPQPHPFIELHITTASKSEDEGKKRVKVAAEKITQLILEHGGKIDVSLS